MKIIFLEAVQSYGGARKSTIELAFRLKEQGDDVLVVDFWGACSEFTTAAKSYGLNLKILIPENSPRIIKSSTNLLQLASNYYSYFFEWLKYRDKVNDVINQFNPDIIVVNNNKTLSILRRDQNYKIVFFARGWFTRLETSFVKRFFLKKLVDRFVGVSQSTRQAIYTGGFAKMEDIYVVQNAVDLKAFEHLKSVNNRATNTESNRTFTILHSAGFLPSKGQHISVNIARKLKERNIPFKLIFTGIIYPNPKSTQYFAEIQQMIEKFELNNNIDVVLNSPNFLEYFHDCDILIHPSATEGLPRVVMEAMAFGKPVVANSVGGVTDFILDKFTGFLTDKDDLDDYVNRIIDLYDNPSLYNFISSNASKLIQSSFDTSSQIEKMSSVLKKIYHGK